MLATPFSRKTFPCESCGSYLLGHSTSLILCSLTVSLYLRFLADLYYRSFGTFLAINHLENLQEALIVCEAWKTSRIPSRFRHLFKAKRKPKKNGISLVNTRSRRNGWLMLSALKVILEDNELSYGNERLISQIPSFVLQPFREEEEFLRSYLSDFKEFLLRNFPISQACGKLILEKRNRTLLTGKIIHMPLVISDKEAEKRNLIHSDESLFPYLFAEIKEREQNEMETERFLKDFLS